MFLREGRLMDTYIIRIYRCDPDDPVKISGLVETVGSDEKKVFTSLDELCNAIVPGKSVSRERPGNLRPCRTP